VVYRQHLFRGNSERNSETKNEMQCQMEILMLKFKKENWNTNFYFVGATKGIFLCAVSAG
jgi:hypothetical protein